MSDEMLFMFMVSTVVVFLYAIAGATWAASEAENVFGRMFAQAVLVVAASISASLLIIHFTTA